MMGPNDVGLRDVDPHIRDTFYRSVFTQMHVITEQDMNAITWEMVKEVNRQRLLHEDEFFPSVCTAILYYNYPWN